MTLLTQSYDTRRSNPLIRHRWWHPCCAFRMDTNSYPLTIAPFLIWPMARLFSLLSMITAIAYHMTTDDRIHWFAIGYERPVVLHVNQQFSADYCADYNQANSALLTGRWSLLNAAYSTPNDHDSIESGILSNPFLGEPKVTPVLQSLASKPSHTKVYIQNLKTARWYKNALKMNFS